VSYALEYSREANEARHLLPIWLQEETIDEIDRLCDDEAAMRAAEIAKRRKSKYVVFDFVRLQGLIRHYVFLTIDVAPLFQTPPILRIRTIGYFARLAQ